MPTKRICPICGQLTVTQKGRESPDVCPACGTNLMDTGGEYPIWRGYASYTEYGRLFDYARMYLTNRRILLFIKTPDRGDYEHLTGTVKRQKVTCMAFLADFTGIEELRSGFRHRSVTLILHKRDGNYLKLRYVKQTVRFHQEDLDMWLSNIKNAVGGAAGGGGDDVGRDMPETPLQKRFRQIGRILTAQLAATLPLLFLSPLAFLSPSAFQLIIPVLGIPLAVLNITATAYLFSHLSWKGADQKFGSRAARSLWFPMICLLMIFCRYYMV